jgi:alpha-mannosidase
MHQPQIAVFNPDVWEAWHDLAALADMIDPLPKDDTRRARIIFALNKAIDLIDYQDISPEALRRSARAVRKALKPVLDSRASASAQTIACMGHAHIDVAWLWPLAETIRKCARTFSSAIEYMDRYPEYVFCQSQPHLYEFTRDHYPALYKRIKEKVRKGQFVPTGCMWVEADCNVTSGESLVRQVLFGTRFFREEFGHEVACLWLPDVFGYSAAMPQILKRSGINYFLTQKISWCQFTTFPYHSFWWEGIDGSTVLAHFPPSNDYNSQLRADQMLGAARRYREKDRSPIQAVPYGFGDGGGGPTRDQLERLRRYRDLEGVPKLAPMTAPDFFHRLEAESTDLRTWVGELYLELHRGTLTTQANNKKLNRKSELALRDAEILSAINLCSKGTYRQGELNGAWKTVLLNQFHDIIPGSSISLVYLARFLGTVPSIGHAVFHIRPGESDAPEVRADDKGMENDLVRIRFDRQGRIRGIFDKVARREAVPQGAIANQLILF